MSGLETAIRIRSATQDDLGILWDFLAIAAHEADVTAARAVPFVAAYLAGWQRSEDFGFIAERDAEAIGAAWAREFSPDEQPVFFVDDRTREVTIGVSGAARGQGVGASLLSALIAEAARRRVGLCLNVRHAALGTLTRKTGEGLPRAPTLENARVSGTTGNRSTS